MNHKFHALLAVTLAVVLTAMGACNSDDDYTTTTDTRSCAITALTFGTLKRTMHTTSSTGADSTYTVSVTGSLYPLSIDQVGNHIYNVDSLPVGTNISKIVFSTASSTGVLAIRTLSTEIDSTFSTTDSTDCSVPRQLVVYSYGGEASRAYTLNVRVHTEYADTFRWSRLTEGDTELQRLEGTPRIVQLEDSTLIAYGLMDSAPAAFIYKDGVTTSTTDLPTGFDPASVIQSRSGEKLYGLADEGVVTSTDGIAWTAVGSSEKPDQLLCAGTNIIEALKDGAFISSTDGGVTWTADALDDADAVPATNVRGTVVPSRTDADFEDVVVIGRKADGNVIVWRRNIDITGGDTYDWYSLPSTTGTNLVVPNLNNPSLSSYDGYSVLTGLTTSGAFAPVYVSRDNGRSWEQSYIKALTLPSTDHVASCVGQDNYIYVLDVTNGSIYRGRHNRLGWNDEQTSFEKARRK